MPRIFREKAEKQKNKTTALSPWQELKMMLSITQ
jgi:hypothetical protein